jgi:hypothetical protein
LTSNATYLNMVMALSARHIVEVLPLRPKATQIRRLLATPYMDSLLKGARPETGFPHYRADFLFGSYAAGHLVTVSLAGNSEARPDMERLAEIDEVWALCFRVPNPGWRFLGRFLQRDLFIGLRAYDRHELGRRKDYHRKAEGVIEDWNSLFEGLEPCRGTRVNDYLSGVWRDVDQKET